MQNHSLNVKTKIAWTLTLMLLGTVGAARASAQSWQRTELPITRTILSDGTPRYSVQIKIGSRSIMAGLDTGSVGLRVLSRFLYKDYSPQSSIDSDYIFGSGVELKGNIVKSSVTFGDISGSPLLEFVREVGCVADQPHCPAKLLPPSEYGLLGDGLPYQGFGAILGLGMGESEIHNPLLALGVHRWIIEIPQRKDSSDGRLILNPTQKELEGFIDIQTIPPFSKYSGALHDAVRGCIINTDANDKDCGVVILDTGDPGIRIISSSSSTRHWKENIAATLILANEKNIIRAAEKLETDSQDKSRRLKIDSESKPTLSSILTGLCLYNGFYIMYDQDQKTIAFKPRLPQSNSYMSMEVK
ncbi:MAG: hypothetical protein ABF479_16640 [Gluconacetobacter sp.]